MSSLAMLTLRLLAVRDPFVENLPGFGPLAIGPHGDTAVGFYSTSAALQRRPLAVTLPVVRRSSRRQRCFSVG
jgi:hypothetical protein